MDMLGIRSKHDDEGGKRKSGDTYEESRKPAKQQSDEIEEWRSWKWKQTCLLMIAMELRLRAPA